MTALPNSATPPSALRALLSERWERLHERVQAACARSGRRAEEVTIVAVTKYAPLAAVRELISLGATHLGESRPQQLVTRARELDAIAPAALQWHLIGHLQRNKADLVVPHAAMIHSVDSERLFEKLASLAVDRRPPLLLEVNITGEASKSGFAPEELRQLWPQLAQEARVEIAGLMTMAEQTEDPQTARPTFDRLRELRDELAAAGRGPHSLGSLSMGMSGDFEVAIEAGATHIRVGSTLFENLPVEAGDPE